MNILIKMIFGSYLYGTAIEGVSDKDFKGVFMPEFSDILLARVSKSYQTSTKNGDGKNTTSDVDSEFYSLHYFIELACQGQTVALDMLHAPESMCLISSHIWRDIVAQRHLFYTRNLDSFIGYARRQASKYGIKGSRLSAASSVIDFLKRCSPFETLGYYWEELPLSEHIFKHPGQATNNNLREYEVCGRKFQETASISYVLPIIEKFYANYGDRARQAAENKNIDWKAISHAYRAALQVKQILTEKTITFPLPQAAYLRDIKTGKLDYSTVVAPELEKLMAEVEALSLKSDLPERVDRAYWDYFIKEAIRRYYW